MLRCFDRHSSVLCLYRIMCETVRYERHEANEVLY